MNSFYLKKVGRFLLIATHLHPVYACANTPHPLPPGDFGDLGCS